MPNPVPYMKKGLSWSTKVLFANEGSHGGPVTLPGGIVIDVADAATITAAGAGLTLEKGQVMARLTAAPNKHVAYDNTRVDGGEVAAGLLMDDVHFDDSGEDMIAALGIGGVVYEAACVGLDAGAKTDLKLVYFIAA